jgi:16S rRNA G966 N2-methylase RsmD
MFAGIGTDTLRMASHAGRVLATEINPETFACLLKNTINESNIEVFNRDCCSCLNMNFQPDVIYFDPPWGESYKTGQSFSFTGVLLSNGQEITVLFEKVRKCFPDASFIIKTPFLCDFEKNLNEDDIKYILTFSRQKLKYIFI